MLGNLVYSNDQWAPDLRQYAPATPWVLIGTKSDLYGDGGRPLDAPATTKAEAEALAVELGAQAYLVTSALTQEGVQCAFSCTISTHSMRISCTRAQHCPTAFPSF